MGTKTGFPWAALSPKPARLLSQVCGCSFPRRPKEGRSRWPFTGQPERPKGSRSGAAARSWPLRGLAPLRPPATAREVQRSAQSSARRALTLAAGRQQAGGESQQQRARRCRRPALHPADGPGPWPRRSFPRRWAHVAHSSNSSNSSNSNASDCERTVRPAPRRAPSGRKLACPRRPVFLPAPVPTLQTEHKAL